MIERSGPVRIGSTRMRPNPPVVKTHAERLGNKAATPDTEASPADKRQPSQAGAAPARSTRGLDLACSKAER